MTTPHEILFKEAYIIIQAAKQIGDALDPIVNIILENVNSEKHLIITGIGKNSDIAKKTAATYSSIGIPSFYLDAYEALHGDLGVILENQVVIGLSKSGETQELNYTFNSCGNKKAKLISLTCKENSSIEKITNSFNGIHVSLPCEFEADHLNVAPTCSSTLFLAIMDAIGCTVSYKLGFTKEKFLENHPAGSLGKLLKEELEK